MSGFNTIDEILADIRAGKMAVLMDDEDRENEGDLIMAAECVRAELLKLLVAKGAVTAIEAMSAWGLLLPVIDGVPYSGTLAAMVRKSIGRNERRSMISASMSSSARRSAAAAARSAMIDAATIVTSRPSRRTAASPIGTR